MAKSEPNLTTDNVGYRTHYYASVKLGKLISIFLQPICRGSSSLFSTPRIVCCFDYVVTTMSGTPLQLTLHWLRLPQRRVDFKVAVMVFRVLHGLAPSYLNQLVRVADLPGRCRLRSSSSLKLLVLTSVGRRTFPVAALLLWNSLPLDIQSSPSLPAFRKI